MPAITIRAFLWSLGAALTVITSAGAQNLDDAYFDWPMGREDLAGTIVMGHDVGILQNYANVTHPEHGPRPHAGVDLWWVPRGVESWGTNTDEAPVYAAANGTVICEHDRPYPGRVIVIEHQLPTGQAGYSQYGHLQPADEDPEAIAVGALVRRGQRIGGVADQGSNSHLHFEIRDFGMYPGDGRCAGPGYGSQAPPRFDRSGRELSLEERERIARRLLSDEGWRDPVTFYYRHRPPFPGTILLWSRERRNVRSHPSLDLGTVVGEIPASSRLTAYGVSFGTNPLNWWYRIRWGRRWAWVNAVSKGNYGSTLAVGEVARSGAEPPPSALIHYRFDEPGPFSRGIVPNVSRGVAGLDGLVQGNAHLVAGPMSPALRRNRYAVQLDGDTAFVEVDNSASVDFEDGVAVSAMVRRDTNRDEDAILSKWYGNDQWLLTFYPVGAGKLIFTVRHQNGAYLGVEYLLPDESYLGKWVQVDARYEIIDEIPFEAYGLLRLYWGGVLVAARRVDAQPFRLWSSTSRIHVGDAGAGTSWSRFHGAIDEVRIWQPHLRR